MAETFCFYIPGHNILELHILLLQVRLATSKTKFDIWYHKIGIRIASRVAERCKTYDLRKIGNVGKILSLVGDIAQFPVSFSEIKPWQ